MFSLDLIVLMKRILCRHDLTFASLKRATEERDKRNCTPIITHLRRRRQ